MEQQHQQAPDDLVLELQRWPRDEEDALVVDVELIRRRLAMTVAERARTHYQAKRLIDRLVKRLHDKYAIQVWFH